VCGTDSTVKSRLVVLQNVTVKLVRVCVSVWN
jgi:hypothetical protein